MRIIIWNELIHTLKSWRNAFGSSREAEKRRHASLKAAWRVFEFDLGTIIW